MKKESLLKATKKVASLFTVKKSKIPAKEQETISKEKLIHLNYALFETFLHAMSSRKEEKGEGLSNPSRLSHLTKVSKGSKGSPLSELIKHAEKCCDDQDLHLIPFKQIFLEDSFTVRKVIQWKLSKYFKTEKALKSFVDVMEQKSPEVFRKHLITLFEKGELNEPVA